VLLGKRHSRHAFMPGHYVFPGGRIEAADRLAPAFAELHPRVEARLGAAVVRSKAKAPRAVALAAIRETFEETGMVIGRKAVAGVQPAPGGRIGAATHKPWGEFLATGFLPDLSGLRFIARAITPPRARRRFDARFLAIDAVAIAHRAPGVVHPEAELTELIWVGLTEALKLPLPDITEMVLADLAGCIAAGLPYDSPVPFYRGLHRRYIRELL
jgi:8-oxo-dGTP pyrophosphatase MutT (NUDIX family)